jgi:TolB protein
MLLAAPVVSRAALNLRLDQPNIQPIPIALPPFAGAQPNDQQVGRDVASVISADLERSGLFQPLDARAFIQQITDVSTLPRFGDWRLINAQALVTGGVESQPDGHLKVEFRCWDVIAGEQLVGKAYTSTAQAWRRMAHLIADEIYKRITGEDGYFDTRIVYISETGPATRRLKRLAIMDQDGANHKFLTNGPLVLTPRFSPTRQEITYLSYASGTPRVYIFNIDSGQQEVLGDFPGMTYAPRFSPDGNKVIMSFASGGNSAIYTLELRTRQATRITDNTAIDTSPCYSPDGQQVVFNSDRGA